ncbi:NADH:flavin oxidoreductase [Cobetia sp. cqz5-12]|uniref:NADH:flavin oxidoreductase n=1 Tax=Cobetia sp. cqz5-12 TaxID=2609415 RepID=UPI0019037D3B|nr:NADH:flavin oxidoreductase [Cobetia sp. cqz5-12]QQK64112.1 NADH:flavin oxidoreductase [Cobetia sp. cqz5-12]
MAQDPLLTPFTLKHLTLKNRLMMTSHEPAYPEDGMPKARYRAYHEERARAGIALTMTAGSASVAKDSPPVFNNILAWRDEVVPWMSELTDACHEHGTAVMIQLTHLGRRTRWDKADWLPAVSASHRREAAHRAFPKRVEDWDITRLIQDYADAAERMQAAGLDGIELQAYGHLMDQFWSPLTNILEGPYGGSLENRLRFTMEVLSAIRARVGKEFIVGVRYTGDECLSGGLDANDGLEVSRLLRDSGQVDFLNVVRGHIDTDAGLTDVIPIQGMASAPHLDFAGQIREAMDFPTFHGAKIQDIATARHAIATGKVDMVGMTRAHMADPHIVRKLLAGKEEDIRPCVGANYCLDRIYQGGSAYCIHNAATGRELEQPHDITPAEVIRKVVIIGAGPAGLEAARVAGERGHQVVVLEAADQPGGQIRLTAQSGRRREMIGIIDWRISRCEALGVQIRYNVFAEAEDVLAEHPDVVIVATGGYPEEDMPQVGSELVVSSWDILSGHVTPGRNVLLFDDAGDHAALQAAEMIANSGARLEMMTPDRTFAPEIMAMNLVPYMRSLQRLAVTFTPTYRLGSVTRSEEGQLIAHIGSDYLDDAVAQGKGTGAYADQRIVDQVVVNYGARPMEDLYFELKPYSRNGGAVDYDALIEGLAQPADGPSPEHTERAAEGSFQLYRIGDAVATRNTHAAIYDALRLMKVV